MADPLTLLKQYNTGNRLHEIQEKDNKIIFGDLAWPKSIDTNYILWGTGKDGIPKEYYTLECVLFLLKNIKKAHPKYVKDAAKENIPVVRRPDRRELLSYLNAEISTSNSIDRSAPLELPIQIKKVAEEKQDYKQTTKFEEEKLLKDKERLSAWLDAPKETQMSTENIRSLSDAMSIEKIAQIKAKRLAKKRSTIKGTLGDMSSTLDNMSNSDKEQQQQLKNDSALTNEDNVEGFHDENKNKHETGDDDNATLGQNDNQMQGGKTDGYSSLSKLRTKSATFVDSEIDFTRFIQSREQSWRTRDNILQSAGKVFSLNITAILQSIKVQEQNLVKPPIKESPIKISNHMGRPAQNTNQSHAAPNYMAGANAASILGAQPAAAAQQYSRYDQERFKDNKEVADFKIDTMGSYHGMTLKSVATAQGPPLPSQQRRNPAANNTNHHSINHNKTTSITTLRKSSSAQMAVTVTSNSSGGSNSKRVSRTPIIIIPATTSSLITMINAKDILQELKYFSEDDKRAAGAIRESDVLIQRVKEGGLSFPYRIIDNPLKLSPQDWDRVVAVFVQGPAWQFKGWPWDGNPVEIFSKIKAFHLKWEELKLDANVAKWDVHVIPLSRTKRHLDRASLLKFWEVLDRHTAKNKPHLRT